MMTQTLLKPKLPKSALPKVARVVVALADTAHARAVQAMFRRQGWDVVIPMPDADPRTIVRRGLARAVVMDAAPAGRESGYLTCKKLLLERPTTKVVLVGTPTVDSDRRLATFVGASALVDGSNPIGVVSAVMGLRLSWLN